jgi:toxin ParE1/3/4
MPEVILSETAQRMLRGIARYTDQTWGRRQRIKYIDALRKRFVRLAKSPLDGRPYKDGLRYFKEGKHLIFYLTRDDGVFIADILHESMDIEARIERWTLN